MEVPACTVLDLLPKGGSRTVLVAGSGLDGLPDWEKEGYKVTRLDIEPRVNPDICAPMTNMGEIGQFDVVYCCHALEHLYPHEVHQALREFQRVLKPGGVAVLSSLTLRT
jgi:predicted SAM-dependent methyltransferase